MNNFSNLSPIKELQPNNKVVYKEMYTKYYPAIASYIKQNNGNDEDAKDVFQDAILVFLEKEKHPDFTLTSSLSTYLFAVSKNIWLKKLRDNKLIYTDEIKDVLKSPELITNEEIEDNPIEKISLWLNNITKHCQNILKALFFYNQSTEALMNTLGWKNKHTADNQKYKCIQQLKKSSKGK